VKCADVARPIDALLRSSRSRCIVTVDQSLVYEFSASASWYAVNDRRQCAHHHVRDVHAYVSSHRLPYLIRGRANDVRPHFHES